jgi:hypothetical protein
MDVIRLVRLVSSSLPHCPIAYEVSWRVQRASCREVVIAIQFY